MEQFLASEKEHIRVHHLTSGNEITTLIRNTIELETLATVEDGIQWVHIPVNSMILVALCFAKYGFYMHPEISDMKLRPSLKQVPKPRHSLHMEASCTEGNLMRNMEVSSNPGRNERDLKSAKSSSQRKLGQRESSNEDLVAPVEPRVHEKDTISLPPLTLYLPYASWISYSNHEESSKRHELENDRTYLIENLHGMLQVNETETKRSFEATMNVHPRRTLDQFYYPSLSDTSARDKDQTISKWTGSNVGEEGREAAERNSTLLTVDQLWCWVIDDKTIISCFPCRETDGISPDFCDLYESVKKHANACKTVWDMQALLVREAISYTAEQNNKNVVDLIETYKWVSRTKAARQTSYVQDFLIKHHENHFDSAALDDSKESKLVLEVSDIVDELKMIKSLVQTQRGVLKTFIEALTRKNPSTDEPQQNSRKRANISKCSFTSTDASRMFINLQNQETLHRDSEDIKLLAQDISGAAASYAVTADETLVSLLKDLDEIKEEADYTHRMLQDLLDLKSKAASLAEARSTTKQGQAVMLFTIVTIIFLPLSFFTSYFGQNVSEFTGDDKNPSSWDLWKVGTPITVIVIAVALLIALLIMKPDWRRSLVLSRSDGVHDVEAA